MKATNTCLACTSQISRQHFSSSTLKRHGRPLPSPSSLTSRHQTSAFSTSTIRQAISTLNMDEFDDDNNSAPTKPKKTKIASKTRIDLEEEESSSIFFDPSLPASEQIQQCRAYHEKIRYSNDPNDHEAFLRMYRSLADDPALLAQLQPKDFMTALNSTRDMLHVIPRMQRILQDVAKTSHRHIPELYHILLKTYTKLSDFRNSMILLERMEKSGIAFNNATYHIMLSICKHERSLGRARQLLEEMRDRQVPVTGSTYLLMLSVCAACKNPRMAREFFDEMPLIGLEADVSHYNALMNCYVHARDLEGAQRVYRDMRDEGIAPDSYTYAALCKILMTWHRTQEAAEIVQKMEKKGLKPNARILMALKLTPQEVQQTCKKNGVELSLADYNMLISASLRQNKFQHMQELVMAMTEQGLRPDAITFTVMVDANLKMGKYAEAKEIFRAMELANIQPDVVAYSALISGALSQSMVLESLEILKTMVADGLLPNLLTFNSLLSSSVGNIDIRGFQMIRETMDALRIRPDQRSFNALLSAYALQGDMDQNGDLRYSMEWYYKMLESGMKPATLVVNNLMAALHGSGEGQKVLLLWQEMGRRGIRKNEQSYEIVLEACEKYDLQNARRDVEEEFKDFLAKQCMIEEIMASKHQK
ncbi:hypothetical protein BG006_009679 [Podila minutissima]|uniref:PROP1-like PPR domain-containing protein n=1 Tax=Podila minutissima TaxID=64525 RepID=A0A9P5SE88_9FUNG|nr:hypothetical protein BG006_009679 [Podila minutissima]